MDPRKAATITEQSLTDAFKEGMAEGVAQAKGESVPRFRVSFYMGTVQLRKKVYEDMVEALTAVGEHLAHGVGTNATITVIEGGDEDEGQPELPDRVSD